MRKAWLLAVVGLLTIVFALGAVACDDDEEDDDTNGDIPTAVVTDPIDDATEPADETPEDGETPEAAAPIDVTINSASESTVAGTATISPLDDDGTEVVVDVTAGLTDGTAHQSHIHHGTCADPTGPIHVNLDPIDGTADGSGSTTTTNPTDEEGATPPFAHWQDVDHYVAVHDADGAVIGCGDVG